MFTFHNRTLRAIIMALVTCPALGQVVYWDPSVGGNGHWYQWVNDPGITWLEARSAAEQSVYAGWQGYLVTITNQDETDFLISTVLSGQLMEAAFIGADRDQPTTDQNAIWHWVTGEDWEYANWRGGEPNGSGTSMEVYTTVHSSRAGLWNDIENNITYRGAYIIEFGTYGDHHVLQWITDGPGEFGDGTNWDTGWNPTEADHVLFNLPSYYNVQLALSQTVALTSIEQGTVAFEAAGHVLESTWGITIGGAGQTCSMDFIHGGLETQTLTLATDFSDDASLDIGGSSTNWSELYVSKDAVIGRTGHGSVYLRDKALIDVFNQDAIFGQESTGSGTVTIDGPGAWWFTHGKTTVGQEGLGELSVINAGYFSTENMTIGETSVQANLVSVDGAGSQLLVSDVLRIASFGHGQLQITAGGFVSADSVILAAQLTSSGQLMVSGTDSTLSADIVSVGQMGEGSMTVSAQAVAEIGSGLFIGMQGDGTLRIENGGVVNALNGVAHLGEDAGSIGRIVMDGADSTLVAGLGSITDGFVIGVAGHGQLMMTNGADVSVASEAVFAQAAGSSAEVHLSGGSTLASGPGTVAQLGDAELTLHGSGTRWNVTGQLEVGVSANGQLTLQNGATVSADSLLLGDNGPGSAQVSMDGAATLQIDGGAVIGGHGQAQLLIHQESDTGQARFESQTLTLAAQSGGEGWLHLEGSYAEAVISGVAIVGDYGQGRIDVIEGATLVSSGAYIARNVGSNGRVNVWDDGSVWVVNDDDLQIGQLADNGGEGLLDIDGGLVQVQGDTRVRNHGTIAMYGGELRTRQLALSPGQLHGTGTIVGKVDNGGLIYIGASTPGTLIVDGDYEQASSGALKIRAAQTAHDLLSVTGSASLDGKLVLVLEVQDVLVPGNSFTILTASSVTGTFDFLSPIFNDVNYFNVIYQSNAVLLEVLAHTHAGDANEDNIINLADLQILGDHWQSTSATWATGDFTGDGVVNLADLQILGDNWGFGASSDMAFDQALQQLGLNVPEPASLAVVLLLMGGCLRRTRARAQQR